MIAVVTLSDSVILLMFIAMFGIQLANRVMLKKSLEYTLYVLKKLENAVDSCSR